MDVLRRDERGVTLIELLAAIAVLGVVVLAVVGMFTQSISINATGMDYIQANSLARDRLEQLMALPFDHQDISVEGYMFGMDKVRVGTDVLPDDIAFTRTYSIRELRIEKTEVTGTWQDQLTTTRNPGDGNLKEITVVVSSLKPLLMGRREIRVVAIKAEGLR